MNSVNTEQQSNQMVIELSGADEGQVGWVWLGGLGSETLPLHEVSR